MILLFLNIRSFGGAHAEPDKRRHDMVNRKKKKAGRIVFEFLVLTQKMHLKSEDVVRKIIFNVP